MVHNYSAVTELNEHQIYMAQMKSSDGFVDLAVWDLHT